MYRIILFFLVLISGTVLSQDKEAILFGGACDDEGRLGLLEAPYGQFKSSSETLEKRGWKTDLKFGKDSSKTQLMQKLDNAIHEAQKGKLKKILIGTLTHGRPSDKTHAHAICVGGENKWMEMNDPEFLGKLEQLKKTGVQIGIIDASCFSGGSIEHLKKYGCVISAQSSNRPTWGSGPFEALNRLAKKEGISLTDVWRDNLLNNSFSLNGYMTMPGNSDYKRVQEIQEDVMKILLQPHWTRSVEREKEERCEDSSFSAIRNLNEFMDSLKKVTDHIQGSELKELHQKITDDLYLMKKKIDEARLIEDEIKKIDAGSLELKKYVDQSFMQELSPEDWKKFKSILSLNFGVYLDFENGKAELNTNDITKLSDKIDRYIKDQDLLKHEKLERDIILKTASSLLALVRDSKTDKVIYQSQRRQSLVLKLMVMQDQLGGGNQDGQEKDFLMNRIASNVRRLIALAMNSTNDGDCTDFSI